MKHMWLEYPPENRAKTVVADHTTDHGKEGGLEVKGKDILWPNKIGSDVMYRS